MLGTPEELGWLVMRVEVYRHRFVIFCNLGNVLPADWALCFRGEGWALPEAVNALCVSQTPEAMGERCLGDSSRIPPDGEETRSRAVWRSVDG